MWASPIARFVGCRPAQASVVLRKPVQIIVMSVTIVTLAVFIGLLRDAASTFSGYRHFIVTVSVTEETPDLSGLLATMTVMTLLSLIYRLILNEGMRLYFIGPYPFNLTRRTRRQEPLTYAIFEATSGVGFV